MRKRIDVVQLGPSIESMQYGAVEKLLEADVVVLQSRRPGASGQIASRREKTTVDLDRLFEEAEDFDALYAEGASTILSMDGAIVFGCIGEPSINGFVRALEEQCDVHFCGGYDLFADAMRAGASLPWTAIDARQLSKACIDTSKTLLVTGVDDMYTASEAKLVLTELYQADLECVLLLDGNKESVVLGELDRRNDWGSGALLIVPARTLEEKNRYTYVDLLEIMQRLRAPGGCPWDAEQTHETLRPYLIEESYEVADAVDSGDVHALYDELGDVLLQVVFHAQIGREEGSFDMNDVTTAVCAKMIRRHPHVFGEVQVQGSDEVLQNWDRIKQTEKNEKTYASAMEDIPRHMSALLRAAKIQKKAANLGFEWPEPSGALEKVREETEEFEDELEQNGPGLEAEGGDLLFAVVNTLRMLQIDPETALSATCRKFIDRFRYIEEHAQRDLRELSLAEMDALWDEAKKEEISIKNCKGGLD